MRYSTKLDLAKSIPKSAGWAEKYSRLSPTRNRSLVPRTSTILKRHLSFLFDEYLSSPSRAEPSRSEA